MTIDIMDIAEKTANLSQIIETFFWFGFNPLHRAVHNRDINKVIKLLKKKKNLVNKKARWGMPPLHITTIKFNAKNDNLTKAYSAERHKALKIAEILLQNGAKVDQQCKTGYTAFMRAVIDDNRELAALLAANGADINLTDNRGRDAYYYSKVMERDVLRNKIIEWKRDRSSGSNIQIVGKTERETNKIYKNISEVIKILQVDAGKKTTIGVSHISAPALKEKEMPFYIYRGQEKAFGYIDEKSVEITPENISSIASVSVTPQMSRLLSSPPVTGMYKYWYELILFDICRKFCKHPYVENIFKHRIYNYEFFGLPFAQHYRVPTYGIDVTFNPLVAASFASIGEDKPIVRDNIGVIYRIKVTALLERARLDLIPKELALERPLAQEAALVNITGYDDFNFKYLSDIVEKYYFYHTTEDHKHAQKKNSEKKGLYYISPKEKDIIQDCILAKTPAIEAKEFLQSYIHKAYTSLIFKYQFEITNKMIITHNELNDIISFANSVVHYDKSVINNELLLWHDQNFSQNLLHHFQTFLLKFMDEIANAKKGDCTTKLKSHVEHVATNWLEELKKIGPEHFHHILYELNEYKKIISSNLQSISPDCSVYEKLLEHVEI